MYVFVKYKKLNMRLTNFKELITCQSYIKVIKEFKYTPKILFMNKHSKFINGTSRITFYSNMSIPASLFLSYKRLHRR
jgi:hypothetical protein